VKPNNAEEKLKAYLRRKYMSDGKITSHEDWKDGINAFRNKTNNDIKEIQAMLKIIRKRLIIGAGFDQKNHD